MKIEPFHKSGLVLEDYQSDIELLMENGYNPVAISHWMFEVAYIFKTVGEAQRAFNQFERSEDGKYIGKLRGWWHGVDELKDIMEDLKVRFDKEPEVLWL